MAELAAARDREAKMASGVEHALEKQDGHSSDVDSLGLTAPNLAEGDDGADAWRNALEARLNGISDPPGTSEAVMAKVQKQAKEEARKFDVLSGELGHILDYNDKLAAKEQERMEERTQEMQDGVLAGGDFLVPFKLHTRKDIMSEQDQLMMKYLTGKEVDERYASSLAEVNATDNKLLDEAKHLVSSGTNLTEELAASKRLSEMLEVVGKHQHDLGNKAKEAYGEWKKHEASVS